MAGWTQLPITDGVITRTIWDELRAAITERQLAIDRGSPPERVGTKELSSLSTFTEYRDAITEMIRRFNYPTGSHPTQFMTAWTASDLMESVFGVGVTDWPNLDITLVLASHFNDMKEVLDVLEWAPANKGFITGKFFDPPTLSAATKNAVQDAYDVNLTEANGVKAAIGTQAHYNEFSEDLFRIVNFTGYRDAQQLIPATINNVDLSEMMLVGTYSNNEQDGAQGAERDIIMTIYADTAVPPGTFAGDRAYGVLAGSLVMPSDGENSPVTRSLDVDVTKFTKNVINYYRMSGVPTLLRELSEINWPTTGTRQVAMRYGVTGDLFGLQIKYDFEYKAA